MRYLIKLDEPSVLKNNKKKWAEDWLLDETNPTKKYRYRHHTIKNLLKIETGFKCIYCESNIGHNTPGDIEHIFPSSKFKHQHFEWGNLTIACTECNRRKNDYFEFGLEFLNPYLDKDIEELIIHFGPIVSWKTGNVRAEITIKTLELNSTKRLQLVLRKTEKIEELNNLRERIHSTSDKGLKRILELQLEDMSNKQAEYSGMVKELLSKL